MIDRISQFSEISLHEVLNRLRAGATVVTPNRRLALTLTRKFDQVYALSNTTAWHTADVLPFSAFLEKTYSDALYSNQAHVVPQLLSIWQERLLWESITVSSDVDHPLLQHSQAAELAQQAWELLHSWDLMRQFTHFPLSDDTNSFLSWAKIYYDITKNKQQIDAARLCDWITENYRSVFLKKPTALICYGFDFFTPQQARLLRQLHEDGCQVTRAYPEFSNQISSELCLEHKRRVEFATIDDEIYHAAVWSRTRLEENPQASIGIVVPNLTSMRSAIHRIFKSVMYPDAGWALPNRSDTLPFNISLGLPLSAYPLVDTALSCLALMQQEMPFNRVSQLIHSPFWLGGESERIPRALLDAELHRFCEPTATLDQLVKLIEKIGSKITCPLLLQCLHGLVVLRDTKLPQSSSYATFARIFTEVLQLSGFPGERNLNSEEYQTYQKWQSLLIAFASLGQNASPVSFYQALAQLKQMAQKTLFQPESPDVPIQILGVLEANHVTFDHLWVMGLSDDQWPLRPNPNPFIPLELQSKTELPFVSPSQSFAYSKQLTQRWLNSANEIILSYPSNSDDGHELHPSALIRLIAETPLHLATWPSQDELIAQSSPLESNTEHPVFAIPDTILKNPMKGGTAVIKDYAACPIRSVIKHRLHVTPLDQPHSGLNALERGTLLHAALANLWQALKCKEKLDLLSEDELEKILTRSAHHAIANIQFSKPSVFSQSFREIELQRLIDLLREWLTIERKRTDFEVTAIEEKKLMQVSKLLLNARIDRIDTLENEEQVVIDYKTSRPSIQTLLGDRLDEPQLPLYLVMTEAQQKAVGAVFASVKTGELGFKGISKDSDSLPGVKAFSQLKECEAFTSWGDLIKAWQRQLTALADGYCSGDARIDPKNYPGTCQQCDMQLICRVSQRINAQSFAASEAMPENDN